jgi:hypothetical protein
VSPSSGSSAWLLFATVFAVAVGAGQGCASSEGEGGGGNDEPAALCTSTREYFTTQIYGKAMQGCIGCHPPGGVAETKGAKFKIYRETWPDFVSANLDLIRDYAKLEIDNTPVLLLKPLGERNHGGGAVLRPESEDYKTFSAFVNELRRGEEKKCNGDGQLGVSLLENRATARKAAITLAGRYPTDAELAASETSRG